MIHRLIRSVLRLPPRRCASDVEHVAVSMRDGVRLATTHIWPIDAEGSTPTLLIRTPYGVETRPPFMIWLGRILAEQGHHVVIQDVRGRYRSEGEFKPFVHEADDGADTLDWLEGQSWSEGPVGMLGASYLTHAAWAAATKRPGRVGSLALAIGSSDLFPLFHPHEMFAFANAVEWAAGLGEREGVDARQVDLDRAFAHEPVREADRVARKELDFYREWVDHPERDAYWQGIDAGLPDPAPPTLLIAGFWDFFIEPQLDDYAALMRQAEAGRGTAPRLLLGPWAHGTVAHWRFWRNGMAKRSLAAAIEHFDATLRGDPASAPGRGARVTSFVGAASGPFTWRTSEDWPPRDAGSASFYFDAHAGRPRLSDAPPEDRVRFEGIYDPLDPTPTIGGKLFGLKAGAKNQAALTSRPDLLCIESLPLERDLELAGPVSATLFVGANAVPADFAVHLIDAAPNGTLLGVCDGIARCHDALEDDTKTLRLDVSLAQAGWRFRAGHRVRLHVAPANCPRFARPRPPTPTPGTTGDDDTATSLFWIAASNDEPSRIDLTLAPGERMVWPRLSE